MRSSSSRSDGAGKLDPDSKRAQQLKMAEALKRIAKEDKKTHLLHPDTMLASIELEGKNWKPTMIHARKAMENGVDEHEVLGMDGMGLIEELVASFIPIQPIQPYKPRQAKSDNREDISSVAADESSTLSSEGEESDEDDS
ncbi:hypothetical protein GUITHDRAFT_111785 [Guillardia theta CCMP2712]|uniref:Uncharacterized protein n=1 Tax=Guillardia theta (strain CCMP2712) TaxID=905079 RepID=L1J1N6_GUITC|nr:hypothetical protein GUITHDRAFT_111785 [Guillardia theta CCMP2712]EKX42222.1 hypothetical protein GUITHDRAFT_111785 [Guillardia theta CCMP2712]|eukprot:XP_005829202.1 hypothetical protein GUITHDRAFT_111785 [Guillardia theta CCMP2712]